MGKISKAIYKNNDTTKQHSKESIIEKFITAKGLYDPTYLTVEFEVNPKSLLFSSTDEDVKNMVNDPVSAEVVFWDTSSLLYTPKSKYIAVTTASKLLYNINEINRYKLLTNFIKGFLYFTKNEQWRIQSIEGLDAVFTKSLENKEPYMGSKDDKISITCLEDVQLTMTYLFMSYRAATYDSLYRRQVIPNNLLKFDCKIRISDRRNIVNAPNPYWKNKTLSASEELNTSATSQTLSSTSKVKENLHRDYSSNFIKPEIEIIFTDCIFDIDQMSKIVENVNPNDASSNVNYTFAFKYGKSRMKYIDDNTGRVIDENEFNNNLEEIYEDDLSNKLLNYSSKGVNETKLDYKFSGIENLIAGGWDGAISSLGKYGKDYLDENIRNGINQADNIFTKTMGGEQGYDVGNNLYGRKSIVGEFATKVGERLESTADSLINKVKENTIGKVSDKINDITSKTQNTLNNLENIFTGNRPNNSEQTAANSTQSEQNSQYVGSEENIYQNQENPTPSKKMETYNIYENRPSGPSN